MSFPCAIPDGFVAYHGGEVFAVPGSKAPGPLRGAGDASGQDGNGERPAVRPNFGGSGGFDPETTALAGIRLPWNQAGQPFFDSAIELLTELLQQVGQLTQADHLKGLVERLLGPQCFTLGVIYGMGENFVVSAAELMKLIKMFLLAELHDATHRNPGSNGAPAGGIVQYLPWQILSDYLGQELEAAARDREVLKAEIDHIFHQPAEFFGELADQYLDKFKRFHTLAADSSPESQFQAGRVFGDLLIDVLAVVGGGGEAVTKAAAKLPRLQRLARQIEGKLARRGKASRGGTTDSGGAAPAPPPPPRPSTQAPRERKAVDLDEPPALAAEAPAPVTPPVVPKIPASMTEKILLGAKSDKGKLIGAHSREILTRPEFNVKVLKTNLDGTVEVMVKKQWPDGTWSPAKPSTLPPAGWTDTKVIEVTERLAAAKPVGLPRPPKGDTLHSSTVDGVLWVVIKEGGKDVAASYPAQKPPGGFGL